MSKFPCVGKSELCREVKDCLSALRRLDHIAAVMTNIWDNAIRVR